MALRGSMCLALSGPSAWLAAPSAQVQQELVESKQLELIAIEAGLRAAETELDFMADAKEVRGSSAGPEQPAGAGAALATNST